jgi:Nuclease-related domain
MKVTTFACGPAANESEQLASSHLKTRLQSVEGPGGWALLTNLTFSVTNQLQADEIDLVLLGPSGVRVVEVKHWTSQWMEAHTDVVHREADKLTNKARKIGTTLRKLRPALPHVSGAILLTQESSKTKKVVGKEYRGVKVFSLQDWRSLAGVDEPTIFSDQDIAALSRALEPRAAVALDGSLRRLAGYVNLELQSGRDERFHRIYKGSHSSRQDRVVLHLYDLSAADERNSEVRARREYDALHKLQLYAWAPRILDSFQDAPGYAGEMCFFTIVDPAAPSIEERGKDERWDSTFRIDFARNCIRAVAQMHEGGSLEQPIFHRNLRPSTILVKHDNSPLLTGFDRAKIPADVTVAPDQVSAAVEQDLMLAPEVRKRGIGSADRRSDVYSLV